MQMTMKKMMCYVFLAGAMLSSCEKEPDLGEMDGDFTVYTQYDPETDFAGASTYFLPDSILTTGQGMRTTYWKDENAQKLIAQVKDEMDGRGYTRSHEKADADLGVQITYVENTVNMVGFAGGYWDGWWDPYYWGAWGTWGYGFPVYYSYSENSLLMEMLDLAAPTGEDEELPVVWNAYIDGDLSGYRVFDLERMARGIDQAFEQSPYIQK